MSQPLRAVAEDYASHRLGVLPVLPRSKFAAISWKAFQSEAPSRVERAAMFPEDCSLNIGVLCGQVSGNLAVIDAETERAFQDQLKHCRRVGVDNTWIDRTPRGGHIWFRTPTPIKPTKNGDVEIRAQGQYVLAPPSFTSQQYEFIHRSPEIIQLESLKQIDWWPLEASPVYPYRGLPRRARKLLIGQVEGRYQTRSEAEQAIITILVNDGMTFDEVLSVFRRFPAAGKFNELDQRDPDSAVEYLRTSFYKARSWCITESPSRKLAGESLSRALSIPWSSRTGSSDRAAYIAHTGLAYRSGGPTYHASSRDVAELAGCDRITGSKATRRLIDRGLIEMVAPASSTFASRFRLVDITKNTNFRPLPHNGLEGVVQTSSFFLPDAFRHRGLGRPAFEILGALECGPLTALHLAQKTGRHVQTVRAALAKLRKFGFVVKTRKMWTGRSLKDIDLEWLAAKVGTGGARSRQHEKHQAQRLNRKIVVAINETYKSGTSHDSAGGCGNPPTFPPLKLVGSLRTKGGEDEKS